MSLGKIGSKTDILQDPATTGVNYTGVTNLVALGGGQPCKYGFILANNSQVATDLIVGTQQVVLNLNPQALSQDEPAATNITYTQNAGKYIERRGQVSKTISLQGTTGYTPTPKIPDQARNLLPQPIIVAQEGPLSGLAQFIQLRNLLRRYWQIFSDDAFIPLRQKTLLIFVNGKDDESWVVEPMSFRMDRASPTNKFTYNYSITLQTVAPVEALVFDPDILTDYQKVGNTLSQVAQAYNTITQATAVMGTALSELSGATRDALQALSSIAQLGAQALGDLVNGTKQVIGVGKVFTGQIDDIKNSYMGAWNNLLGISDYTKTLYGVDPMPFEVHQAMAGAALTMADLSARKELFAIDFPQTWAAAIQDYTPSYGFGGYNQDLVAPLQKSGVQETTILPGDTLQNIAVRELGNAERVMELVLLNQLKPPYISPSQTDRAPNTLAPGDAILIPSESPAETGPRALVRTTVFSDPNFTTLVTGFAGPSTVQVDTRGRDFRPNQWAGFTLDIVGSGAQGGGAYVPPPGYYAFGLPAGLIYGDPNAYYNGNIEFELPVPRNMLPHLGLTGYLVANPSGTTQVYDPATGTTHPADPVYNLHYVYRPNLFDTTSTNISTATDSLQNTTGFAATAINGGSGSGPGAIFDDSTAGATATSSTEQSCQGSRALKVVGSSVFGAGVRTVTVNLQPSTGYSFSFWARAFDNNPSAISVWAVDSDGNALFARVYVSLTTSWQQIFNSFYTQSSGQVQFFWAQVDDTPASFFIDKIMLALVPTDYPFSFYDYVTWDSTASADPPRVFIYIVAHFYGLNFPPGTQVVTADNYYSIPPNQAGQASYDGPVGIITANDAGSLTVDTNLPVAPTVGSMVRVHLVRSGTDLTPRKSSSEQLLGVDLKLDDGDLVVDAAGRLVLVDSFDNINQAIGIKLRCRPGDLAAHPNFGLAFDPGTRVSPNLLFTYRVAVRQTLLSDARIDSLDQVDVILERDVLQLTGYVVLIGSSQPYALDTRGTS